METHEKRALIEYYLNAYNSFEVDQITAAIHPDIRFRDVSSGEVSAVALGIEQFRVLAEQVKQIFSARHQLLKTFEARGNSASITVDYVGILAIDLPNGLKAGETLQLTGYSDFTFRDQKIYELTDYSGWIACSLAKGMLLCSVTR